MGVDESIYFLYVMNSLNDDMYFDRFLHVALSQIVVYAAHAYIECINICVSVVYV